MVKTFFLNHVLVKKAFTLINNSQFSQVFYSSSNLDSKIKLRRGICQRMSIILQCSNKKTQKKSRKYFLYTLKKQRLKITQLEKVRLIKVNEIKLTQVELF